MTIERNVCMSLYEAKGDNRKADQRICSEEVTVFRKQHFGISECINVLVNAVNCLNIVYCV